MFKIEMNTNEIVKLDEKTFADLGLNEKNHLQEWIAKNPSSLGEELLIIQKEFDGFNDTNERLDLLALDKQGNLVIIENKRDTSGRDVTWQAIKYASYCSTLRKDQIKRIFQEFIDKYLHKGNAEEIIVAFLSAADFTEVILNEGYSQRIILISRTFRKEVTSAVLWLMNYNIKMQCFKATPYKLEDKLIVNIEQIIPIKEIEDYVISIASKNQDDKHIISENKHRHNLRLEFWKLLLDSANQSSDNFRNINPSTHQSIGIGSGISGVSYKFVISGYYARVEVWISRANKNENKEIFNYLFKQRVEIESEFGNELAWEELLDNNASRVKYELNEVNFYNKHDWPKMIEFLVSNMKILESVFKKPISNFKNKTKNKAATNTA